MEDLDIYRAANVILKRFGADGPVLYCAQQVDAMFEREDMEGRRIEGSGVIVIVMRVTAVAPILIG